MRWPALVLVLAACKPPGHAATIDCPAEIPTAHAACGGLAGCQYPEGTCTCHRVDDCPGGDPGSYERVSERGDMAWNCQIKRTDGCPDSVHVDDPCNVDHECTYEDCGTSTYRCVAGQWRLATSNNKPP